MARVLITGSSTGIGRATGIELAARGHDVVATARRPETLEDLKVAVRLTLDVTDPASVEAAVAAAGPLDALVSNAGATLRGTVEATPIDEYQRLMDLNFLGALRMTKAVLSQFRRRRAGRIVLVSSILGRLTLPMLSGYSASKFATEALAETLALETAHLGLKISSVQPGAVATDGPASAAVFKDDHEDYAEVWEALARARGGSVITAEDVARAIADLIEQPDPPLRLPIGVQAESVLAALAAAPADRPFRLG
jgi:NADP-dependent 3-hydroxy acid dehydrogenase YdfG